MSTAKGGGGRAEGNGGGASGNGGAASGKGQRSRAGAGGTSGARSGPPVTPAAGAALTAPLTPGRVGIYVLLLVAGVLVAFAGALVQAAWFPGGLVLALAGVGGLFYGGGRATGTSAGVLVPGAAWLVTVFLLVSNVRPEGDFFFGAGLGSYIFLLGGILVAVICATAARVGATGARYGRVGG
ncbi:DUF6113 family protein [Streptomyces hygroscopicus]|uniref:DUF6113 family protein n=1 Tax=Streptomyces hygroscopicus TaxID=1912 RepID=UPI001FCABC21|nr:DUF6113 family protein [Streptomyces hygroscopicus]BDH15087.1 hypothetical protein HOK021_62660 [Streptomyces hygroscopicus]